MRVDKSWPPSVLTGSAAILLLGVNGYHAWMAVPAWLCLLVAVMGWADWSQLRTLPGLLLIVFASSLTLGAIGSGLWGYGEVGMSVALALFAWLVVASYTIRLNDRVFTIFTAGAYLHAGVIVWQGIRHFRVATFRASGIALDQNVAAGFLDVAVVYLVARGRWYFTPPLVLALYMTGSRLGFWGLVFILGLMLMKRALPRCGALALLAVLAMTTAILWAQGSRIYFRDDAGEILSVVVEAAQTRAEGVSPKEATGGSWWLPNGYPGDGGPHLAIVQLYQQGGPVAVVAVGGFLAAGLWRRRWSPSWWVLVLLAGLSVLDYYTIMPPASLLAVMGVRAQHCLPRAWSPVSGRLLVAGENGARVRRKPPHTAFG